MMKKTRREFMRSVACVGAGLMVPEAFGSAGRKLDWGAYFRVGTHMWRSPDDLFDGELRGDDAQKAPTDKEAFIRNYQRLELDMGEWNFITERMQSGGLNQMVIDLGEGIVFPSHPELALKDSWSPDRVRNELRRLRKMGIEPVPKLNFSAGHDVWLGEYHRMVSTRKYYEVCADLIRDVCEIFESPRLFHIGYDEETARNQRNYAYCVVRQGDLWWHDLNYIVGQVEKHGARAWMWSDYAWHHDDFFRKASKGVLQSNWYYGKTFEMKGHPHPEYIRTFLDLEKHGFDQIACGGNWECEWNVGAMVRFCREHIDSDRLKGFLTASWYKLLPECRQRNVDAVDQLAAARKDVENS